MPPFARSALVAASGAAASAAAILLAFAVKSATHFDLYSVFLRFVIPVGALLFGVIGGLGCVVAGLQLGVRPGRSMFAFILAAAFAAHLLYYYLDYRTTIVFGMPISRIVPFWRFLHVMNSSWRATSLTSRYSEHELGSFGYALFVLQWLGFACAGVFACWMLRTQPACAGCGSMVVHKLEAARFSDDGDLAQDKGDRIAALVEDGDIQPAIDEFAHCGQPTATADAAFRSTITVEKCKGCGKHIVRFRMSEKSEDGLWTPMDDYRTENSSAVPIDLRPLRTARG